jgi:hypothetical protein
LLLRQKRWPASNADRPTTRSAEPLFPIPTKPGKKALRAQEADTFLELPGDLIQPDHKDLKILETLFELQQSFFQFRAQHLAGTRPVLAPQSIDIGLQVDQDVVISLGENMKEVIDPTLVIGGDGENSLA